MPAVKIWLALPSVFVHTDLSVIALAFLKQFSHFLSLALGSYACHFLRRRCPPKRLWASPPGSPTLDPFTVPAIKRNLRILMLPFVAPHAPCLVPGLCLPDVSGGL